MHQDRINTLRARHLSEFSALRGEHSQAMRTLLGSFYETYAFTEDRCITADFLAIFAREFPLHLHETDLFAGTMWHWCAGIPSSGIDDVFHTNGGHYIADFDTVMRLGLPGLVANVQALDPQTETQRKNKQDFLTVLSAFACYIERYADLAEEMGEAASTPDCAQNLREIAAICRLLLVQPPHTFRQALQLLWFVYVFLETESCSAAVSFGRADRYLYPFYARDLAQGTLSEDEALLLIKAFYIKVSEGDESSMITLGGDDIDPAFTCLFLRAQTELQMRQPSLSLRVCDTLDASVLEESQRLTLTGCGMPAYFNDKQVIEGLLALGIDAQSAQDYGIVGCYEASPQGAFSNTVMTACFLYDAFYEFVKIAPECSAFEAFYDAFKAHYETYYRDTLMPHFTACANHMMSGHSPFAACCLKGSLDRCLLPEQYGCDYTLFGTNMLGIGVLIDSLYTVKKLVFDEKSLTLRQLFEGAEQNFSDQMLYGRLRALGGGYGSDSIESNQLAKDLSAFIGQVAFKYQISEKGIVSPALFWFTADIWNRTYRATLNGRKSGELLSYGIMPCMTPRQNPLTASLNASSHIQNRYFPNGCPLMIRVTPADTARAGNLILSLLETYFAAGGWHIAFHLADASVLRAAQEDPDRYRDLMVKISGFSTAFVGLDRGMQNALIERTEKGI